MQENHDGKHGHPMFPNEEMAYQTIAQRTNRHSQFSYQTPQSEKLGDELG